MRISKSIAEVFSLNGSILEGEDLISAKMLNLKLKQDHHLLSNMQIFASVPQLDAEYLNSPKREKQLSPLNR